MVDPDYVDTLRLAAETTPPQDRHFTNFTVAAQVAKETIDDGQIITLADTLGVSSYSLIDLGIGWLTSKSLYTFPMFDERFDIIGISTRSTSGDKRTIYGSEAGVFIPASFRSTPGVTFVCEGLSDTAAALSLGLNAVGRFNCGCGQEYLTKLLMKHKVYIIADNGAAGVRGASELCIALATVNKSAHVIYVPSGVTPMKDLRDMVQKKSRAATLNYILREVSKHAS